MITTYQGFKRFRMYQKVKDATVAIISYQPQNFPQRPFVVVGSGFCIHPQGIVITCEHVFRAFVDPQDYVSMQRAMSDNSPEVREISAGQPFALFYKGIAGTELIMVPVPIVNAVTKTDFDLALLKLSPHQAFPDGFPVLEIAEYDEGIHETLEIATCGYPLGTDLHDQMGTVTSSFTHGRISSISPAQGVSKAHLKGFQLDLTATYGNSGGPVFRTDNGKVFGVLQGGPVHPSDGTTVSGLAKAEPVYPALDHSLIERMLIGLTLPTDQAR